MEWLHFSDFHIGGTRGKQIEVLTSLLDKVFSIVSTRPNPIPLVLLAGDIAYAGKAEEYSTFTKCFLGPLLAHPKIAGAKVIAVPGNHDVDCDQSLPVSWDGIQRRNQDLFFCEDNDGNRVRKSRSGVFASYAKFVRDNNIISPDPLKEVTIIYSDSNWPVDILATNTAFFSDLSEHSSRPLTPVPMSSLRHLANSANSEKPLLLIGHHSPSSLIPEHERHLTSFLMDKKAVFIHGHEHNPKASFNPDGTLRTIGFGASYIASLNAPTLTPYQNSFTHCRIEADKICINAFSWESSVGRWVDKTETHFCDCIKDEYEGCVRVQLPLHSHDHAVRQTPTVLASIPRSPAKVSRLIPVDLANEKIWEHFYLLSENLVEIFRASKPVIRDLPPENEKASTVLESGEKRHLLVQIPGINHVLSSKEIESLNTTLDTEDYSSVTVISLGKITEDAYGMYLRLRSRKAIEVLTNKQLLGCVDRILSSQQNAAIAKLDPARHFLNLILCPQELYLLILERTERESSFSVVKSDGSHVLPSDPLVTSLRRGTPEFATMPYSGETNTLSLPLQAFDERSYLTACFKEYNVIKYAALANIGIRFSDLPLEDLYVNATASETETGQAKRLEAVVDDHLASYPVTEALRDHIQKQLLTSVKSDTRSESSMAREFCQKFGAVLLTGDPGSGKTCFVKSEILTYCKERSQNQDVSAETVKTWYSSHVPIMLQLSELVAEADFETKGLPMLASRLLARRGLNLPEDEIQSLSRKGSIAWFFDGLDEVVSVEKRALVVQHINRLVTESLSAGNRIVVTSRPAAVHVVNLLPSFHRLELQGFTESEIRTLAMKILRLKLVESQAGVVLDEVRPSPAHESLIEQIIRDCRAKPGVARLAQNPLLLTLLIMIYANAGAPSAKRHSIYQEAIQTLASVRGREAGHSPISAQDLRERLGAVALSVYKRESGLLPTRREVAEIIRLVMCRQRSEEVSHADASSFLQQVAESTGLIAVESRQGENDANAVVTFMHHSFLEYFAAIGLSRELGEADLSLIVNRPRWHEILTLLSGIIGENEDIAPILSRLLECGDIEDDVDAKLLLFAMDCALECEVPSDAAQRLLAKAIRQSILNGSTRADPWVRSEIGQRLATLFEVCGSANFEQMLVECIGNADADASAAAIGVVGYALEKDFDATSMIEATNKACSRIEEAVLCSICLAAGKAKVLRTQIVVQTIGKCLKKSPRCKRAAFEALASIPSLAADNWAEIINGIDDGNARISRWASLAAVQAGLNADLIALNGNKKDILLRALGSLDDFGNDYDSPQVHLKTETLERMLASPLAQERRIAIQLIPISDSDEKYKYEKLFGILKDDSERSDLVAALHALKSCSDTAALFTQGDLKCVIKWLEAGTRDIRVSAVKLLGRFGADSLAVEALLSRNYEDLDFEDYCASINALANARILKQKVAEFLFDKLEYHLDSRRRTTINAVMEARVIMDALRRLQITAPAKLVSQIAELIVDYKIKMEVKQHAILCYPAIALPSAHTVGVVNEWFLQAQAGFESSLVQVPAILARKCRDSIDFIMACINTLSELRGTMIEFHRRLRKRELSDDAEFNVTELRRGIDEVNKIIVAFDEFIKPDNHNRDHRPEAVVAV